MLKRLVFPSMFALSCLALPTAGRPDVPVSPGPTLPSPQASETACAQPDTIDPDDAFAHVIDDPRTLAFISYLENLPARDRAGVVSRAKVPLPTAVTDEIRKAPVAGCAPIEVAYGGTRLQYAIAKRWSSTDDAIAIGSAARFAIGSLMLGDRVSKQARAATLDVFGTSEDALDALIAQTKSVPTPSPSAPPATGACRDFDAAALMADEPDYPISARYGRVAGQVRLTVALDVHGYVRSVNVERRSVDNSIGGDAIVTAAIISAGVSNYRPEFKNCEPIAGTYLFRADFTIR
jgi:hypothetical protein